MRTYGTIPDGSGGYQWVEVTTDAAGFNDQVYLTTLCQVLQLNRGESPIYGDYGIPVLQSIQKQIPPDLYVGQTQAQFAPFFASLTVARASGANNAPIYNIAAVTNRGAILSAYAAQTPLVDGYSANIVDGYGNQISAAGTNSFPMIPT